LIQEKYHTEQGRYFRTAAAEAGEVFRPAAFPGLELDSKALLEEHGAVA
jgi:hypothetical protein